MQKQKRTIWRMLKEITVLMILTIFALGMFNMIGLASQEKERKSETHITSFFEISSVNAQSPQDATGTPDVGAGGSAVTASGSGGTGAASSIKDASGKPTPAPPATKPPEPENPTTYVPLAGEWAYDGLKALETSENPISMFDQFIKGLFKNLKYVIGAVAVLFIMFAAAKLIVEGDSEEVVETQKMSIFYGILGLVVIGFASEVVKVFYVACPPGEVGCAQGGFLASPAAMIQHSAIFNRTVQVMITFIKYFIGGVALVMLARNGIRLVSLGGEEEGMGLDKQNVLYISVGLILILLSSTIINKVLFVVDTSRYPTTGGVMPALGVTRGLQELVSITNYAVSFAAPIAILVLIVGAIMYATAAGNEDTMGKAKRLIMFAIGGMILIYGAFAIVSTVISGQFTA